MQALPIKATVLREGDSLRLLVRGTSCYLAADFCLCKAGIAIATHLIKKGTGGLHAKGRYNMTKKPRAAHNFERAANDFYQEPPEAVVALLRAEQFIGPIHDPACGSGNIVKTCATHGYTTTGSDIVLRHGMPADSFTGVQDFLSMAAAPAPNIVTNPPYFKGVGVMDFIKHGMALDGVKKMALFCDLRFIGSEDRARNFYPHFPPNMIYFVCPRVNVPSGEHILAGGKVGNGSQDFVWLIYDKTRPHMGTHFGWALHDGIPRKKKQKTAK